MEGSSGWGVVFGRVGGVVGLVCGTSCGGRCCGLIADVRVAVGAFSVVDADVVDATEHPVGLVVHV